MRLIRAEIRNFKLLEDVVLDFSTDSKRPLTVIRAENGSGKTSLLYALLWAFYGMDGLPKHARSLRLASSAAPGGSPVAISVMIEFEHVDQSAETMRYRLIRTVTETPKQGDKVERQRDRVRLLRITKAGEEDVAASEALIVRLVPLRLRDVFFTNGDDVQTFVSGREGTKQRQANVHNAIRALLGLDALRIAAEDVNSVFTDLRRKVAKSGGGNVEETERRLEHTDTEVASLEAQQAQSQEQLANMVEQKKKWNRELLAIRGVGDLDELNDRIAALEKETARLEQQRTTALSRMRELLRSEPISWSFLGEPLEHGIKTLGELADRHVIPGPSVEVLTDRLELGVCICGDPLPDPSERRDAVKRLRDEQLHVSENRQRLTALLHMARQGVAANKGRVERGEDFATRRTAILREFTTIADALRQKGLELRHHQEKRKQIDESRVRELTEKLDGVEKKIADTNTTIGQNMHKLESLTGLREQQDRDRREAEKAAKVNETLALRRDAAEDLLALTRGSIAVLEQDHVKMVSDRMAQIFMSIVGSHPEFEAGVFSGVHISDEFDIIVDTRRDRTLDTDFELNGASQRALTLAFIWALMEVSGITAPRIIDTPLGFVAGGVKTRLVDAITDPAVASQPDFQVVLLLTRSEIRDVESLLDERAGVVRTLSCSKDYPTDLVYEWGVDQPTIRACNCTHREACRVCARHYDEKHGISFRDEEAAV